MKKNILFLFLGFSLTIVSQQKSDFWDHVKFGGGFTLGFGSQTTIGISPSAVYDFDNGFYLGGGVGYLYSQISDFTTNAYNTGITSFYQTELGVQFSADYDYYFAEQSDSFGSSKTNFFLL